MKPKTRDRIKSGLRRLYAAACLLPLVSRCRSILRLKRRSEEWQAEVVAHNLPSILLPGDRRLLGIVFRNTGTRTWYAGSPSKGNLTAGFFVDGVFAGNGELFAERIPPGCCATVLFKMTSPREVGMLTLTVRLAIHNVTYIRIAPEDPLSTVFRVVGAPRGKSGRPTVHDRLFVLRYLTLPIWFLRRRWYLYRFVFRLLAPTKSIRNGIRDRWKAINRSLAALEKAAGRLEIHSYPRDIILDGSTYCNLKCPGCFRQVLDFDLNGCAPMNEKMLEKTIHELFPTAENASISLIGEPLLSPHLERIIAALREHRVALSLTTNGTMLGSEALCMRLAEVLGYLEVSIDSVDPKRFSRLRLGARLSQVLANIRCMLKVRRQIGGRFPFAISMTLYRENLEEIPTILGLAGCLGIDLVRVSFGIVFDEKDRKRSIVNCPEEYNRIYREAHEKAFRYGVELSMPPPFEWSSPARSISGRTCRYLYEVARIDYKGELRPCLNPGAPFSMDFHYGSFQSFWNSSAMKKLRNDHKNKKAPVVCRDCYVIHSDDCSVAYRQKQFFLSKETLLHPKVTSLTGSG